MERTKVLEHLKANLYSHEYPYLNWEDVTQYQSLLRLLSESDGANRSVRRGIQKSMMAKYGLLEIEAINLLNNYHCGDYVSKYQNYQFCDNYRVILLEYLLTMDLPKELQKEQIDSLCKVFLGREKDKEILKVLECEDGEETAWIEAFLQEQLTTKKRNQKEID